jgi:hypothetical protein
VIEKGSSGGMLDEDEDPFVSWEKKYISFEHWFKEFKIKHKDFWIYLYPVYISEEIRSFVMEEVKNYVVPKEEVEWFFDRRDDWYRALGMKDYFSHQQ